MHAQAGIATDNAALHGKHAFEMGLLASRGVRAPFTVVTVKMERSVCDHCGRILAAYAVISDATGKKFHVGSGCVKRTGDHGLYRAYKSSPEVRKFNKAKRDAKGEIERVELAVLIEANKELFSSVPHAYGFEGKTAYDHAIFMLNCAGNSGRSSILRSIKSRLFYAFPRESK